MTQGGISLGEPAPGFTLPDTGGREVSLPAPGEVPASVVIWTCNHCPYALAWHDRLTAVAREYSELGAWLAAISSNDAERFPADSPAAMAERYDPDEWGMPYLYDAAQEVASAYGAAKTPDVFVLDSDRVLRYRGAPDADHQDPALDAAWLRAALDAVLAGADPEPSWTEPVGCSIKWTA